MDYYNRLERGSNLAAASDSVLDAIARALQLNDVERDHLFQLAKAAHLASRTRPRRTAAAVAPGVQAVLDAMVGAPALVYSPVLDVIAMNHLARALYAPMLGDSRRPPNFLRFTFLDPRARDFWVEWPKIAGDMVANLQGAAGRDPHDRRLTELVGELSTCCEEFRVMWARRDVRAHARDVKRFQHPDVGRLDLAVEAMYLPAEQGLTFVAHTAEVGTPSHDNLSLLAAWAATSERVTDLDPRPSTAAQRSRAGINETA